MFKKVDPKQNFPALEEDVLKFWRENKIFEKSLKKDSPNGNFVFYEGPPTANGKPGIHHVLARAFKDLIPRYKTMQGYHVERKAGWDTHGLPVELEVEKKLGISGKPEIEKYGIEEFNKKCKESVWQYKDEWEKLTERIAFWLDLENPYVTYENNYIESLWWIVKQVHDKKLLYKGHKVVPQCPRCGTALSSHEVAQGYKSVSETSVYVKFALLDEKNTFVLAWTTTPWTLPGNVALAIGKDIKYVKVKQNGEFYILAEKRLSILEGDYEIIEELKSSELEGKKYKPLFDFLDLSKTTHVEAYYLTCADFVTTEDGTGVVHTAVMYGEDDYRLGEKIGLPKYHTVDENGKFTSDVKPWEGKFVKDVEKDIVEYLKENNLLYKTESFKHDYPFCWRCTSPLIYYAKDSWFIKMSALRSELIKNNNNIGWVPAHIKEGRFGEWISEVKDWAISRERYWGTPFPVWTCEKDGNVEVIGSIEELKKKNPTNFKDGMDLHRPYIDKVEFKCSCGGMMKREKAVMDCWFDSGAMPFAQLHYPFENKALIDENKAYPADFISEAIDQTRGWFYTLLAISTLLEKGNSYKNVICLGHILDSHGQKMSKSRGNVINPWEVIEKYGADAVRFHLYSINQPGEAKRFDLNALEETLRKNILILWNVYGFFISYAELDNWAPEEKTQTSKSKNILDKWVMAKLNELVVSTEKDLDSYDVFHSSRSISAFINDLSTWYLRRSRKRRDNDFYSTMYKVLMTLSKIISPFMPFIAESIYQNLKQTEDPQSVHLSSWPKAVISDGDLDLLSDMSHAREIVEHVLAKRAGLGIKVRQPLNSVEISGVKNDSEDWKDIQSIIMEEINVKNIKYQEKSKSGNIEIELDTVITPELRKEGITREIIRQIQMIRKKIGLTPSDEVTLVYNSSEEEFNDIIMANSKQISLETKLKAIENKKTDSVTEIKIEGKILSIDIVK